MTGHEASKLTAGRVLDGRFELGEVLGEGGLGTVVRAFDRTLDREVALKVLVPRYRGRPERESRLLTEAELARAVEHEFVVQCLGSGRLRDLGSCPFAVFERVQGESLNAGLARNGAIPPRAAARVLRRLAEAVQACHRAGVVHRDVTVHNVFLAPDGTPTLIDFSHAGRVQDSKRRATLQGEIPGTPWMMSPEQARGEPAQPSMDVFSLGVLAYEMLTGSNPYCHTEMDRFAELQAKEELPAPTLDTRVHPVPGPLAALVNACLVLRSEQRISLNEVVRGLGLGLAETSAKTSVAPLERKRSGDDHYRQTLEFRRLLGCTPGDARKTSGVNSWRILTRAA